MIETKVFIYNIYIDKQKVRQTSIQVNEINRQINEKMKQSIQFNSLLLI